MAELGAHLDMIDAVQIRNKDDARPYIGVSIFDFNRTFLVDSGAARCVIDISAVPDKAQVSKHIPIRLSAANGSPIQVEGTTTLPLKFGSRVINWPFLVVRGTTAKAILGWDFLETWTDRN